jgi:predicted phosphoribosyltransferase
MNQPYFEDRNEAGVRLAEELRPYAGRRDCIVLALPRGGVPVAYEIARELRLPLDLFLVRKLGIDDDAVDSVVAKETAELERRERLFRGDRPYPDLRDRCVILVDDGLATGASMRAAIAGVRGHAPARVVVAVPVGAGETCAAIAGEADEVICAETPEPFYGVGAWYEDFAQTTDAEVRELMERARRPDPIV